MDHRGLNAPALESAWSSVQTRSMEVFATDQFALPLPPGHTFPAVKYGRLREEVIAAGLVDPGNLLVPEAANDEEILRVHTEVYLTRIKQGTLSPAEIRVLGLPWSPELVERS